MPAWFACRSQAFLGRLLEENGEGTLGKNQFLFSALQVSEMLWSSRALWCGGALQQEPP